MIEETYMTGMDGINDDDAAYEKTVPSVCGGYDVKYNTISLCKRAIEENVAGDFAECGVCAGTHPMLMAYVNQRYGGGSRKVHLFDSFEKGFTIERIATADDLLRVSSVDAKCEPSGTVMTSIEQVQQNMERLGIDQNQLVFWSGWVQELLPQVIDRVPPLAVLRIDVDLFSPTKTIFDYLYDKVVSGGYIISDDWGEYRLDAAEVTGARLVALNFFDQRGMPRPQVNRVVGGTVWWRKP